MTIDPPKPEQISRIVEQAFNDVQESNREKRRYSNLSDEKKQELHQLCSFLGFYLCEELGKNIQDEVDALIHALRGISVLPDINDLDRQPVVDALAGLRALKAGGLTPGIRVSPVTARAHLYYGSRVYCRLQPGEIFKVDKWSTNYQMVRITNGIIQADVKIEDLVFIHDAKKKSADQSEIEQKKG